MMSLRMFLSLATLDMADIMCRYWGSEQSTDAELTLDISALPLLLPNPPANGEWSPGSVDTSFDLQPYTPTDLVSSYFGSGVGAARGSTADLFGFGLGVGDIMDMDLSVQNEGRKLDGDDFPWMYWETSETNSGTLSQLDSELWESNFLSP
jgi:hypothetical protein